VGPTYTHTHTHTHAARRITSARVRSTAPYASLHCIATHTQGVAGAEARAEAGAAAAEGAGAGEGAGSGAFRRGRTYNLSFNDAPLVRFTPQAASTQYELSGVVSGLLTFHRDGPWRCAQVRSRIALAGREKREKGWEPTA
jgi:hypothetical protein